MLAISTNIKKQTMERKFWGHGPGKAIALSWVCLIICGNAIGQRFTVTEKNPTLRRIFESIEEQLHIRCDFSGNSMTLDQKVIGRFSNYPLNKFLGKDLAQHGLRCEKSDSSRSILFWEVGAASAGIPSPHMLYHIWGIVMRANQDSDIVFIPDVNVQIEGSNITTHTDVHGYFRFDSVAAGSKLVFTCVNLDTARAWVTDKQGIIVRLKNKIVNLDKVTVTPPASNGIIEGRKKNLAGFPDVINLSSPDRTYQSNLLNRIDYQSSGIQFMRNGKTTSNDVVNNILIRGYSSINAGNRPLIILDNFVFSGDIWSINPEDIASMTILKDAASAAIWGARAGNGVIVITTKKAKAAPAAITATHTFSIQGRPDVFNYHLYPAASQIDMEEEAYQRGYYDNYFHANNNTAALSPVISILHDADLGLISRQEAANRIASMRNYDVRRDLERYFYQRSVEQQYTIQISRKISRLTYFASLGLTRSTLGLTGSTQQRRTGRGQLTYVINKQLSLSASASYADIDYNSLGNPGFDYSSPHNGNRLPTYFRFKDSQGNPTPFYGDYSQNYMQHLVSQGYLDATWNPLLGLHQEYNRQSISNYIANLGLLYTFHPEFAFEIKYQFQRQKAGVNDFHTGNSSYVNDIVDQFMQTDPATGQHWSPIPYGGISNIRWQTIISNQARAQLAYKKAWSRTHYLSTFGGVEFCNIVTTGDTSIQYGIGNAAAPAAINDTTLYPLALGGAGQFSAIPVKAGHDRTADRFISGFLTSTYNYFDRYTASLTFREDFANLWGAATNKKWTPVGALSVIWHISNEPFYKWRFLQQLDFRASAGTLGNISRQSTAYMTISTAYGGITGTPYMTAYTLSLPNENLGWEKVTIYTMAVDFATRKQIIWGTLEPYFKRSSSLMAPTPIDPTRGGIQNPGSRPYALGNSAGMWTSGVDLTLNSRNLSSRVKWLSTLTVSTLSSRLTHYSAPAGMGKEYLDPSLPNPVLSRPISGVYAYTWRGLDKQTGDPQGLWNGQSSKDWNTIVNNTTLGNMVYKGPSLPRVFGYFRNTFTVKDFSLSCTISYRLGYVIRMPAFSSTDQLNNWNTYAPHGAPWQKPGDELHTFIPSIDYSGNRFRDFLAAYSEPLVVRADNIRAEDVILNYELRQLPGKKHQYQHLKVFAGVNNLGPLWIGNKFHYDAFYPEMPKEKARVFGGISISF